MIRRRQYRVILSTGGSRLNRPQRQSRQAFGKGDISRVLESSSHYTWKVGRWGKIKALTMMWMMELVMLSFLGKPWTFC